MCITAKIEICCQERNSVKDQNDEVYSLKVNEIYCEKLFQDVRLHNHDCLLTGDFNMSTNAQSNY
jgi:hypothetical protein